MAKEVDRGADVTILSPIYYCNIMEYNLKINAAKGIVNSPSVEGELCGHLYQDTNSHCSK